MATASLIEAKNINQIFEVNEQPIAVLKQVNFTITGNTFNIIYGASGSGKSTLLNILTGLQQPSSGEIMFAGDDVYKFASNDLAYFRANQIGIVYQQNYWVKSLNVVENVAMPLYFMGFSRHAAAKKAMEALDKVKMTAFADKYPTFLSGGEQQRVAMARAIVNDPLFIIADEPTGSLDTVSGDMIMELLQSCQTDLGRTIILVTHNMEYLPLADHLLHIQDGQVTPMVNNDIHRTTETLITDMKQRIDHLAAKKQRTRKQAVIQ